MASGLSAQHASELKTVLKRRFDELWSEIKQELLQVDNERYVELVEKVHDRGDESAAALLADINLAIVDHHIKEIQAIDAALVRMAQGLYGTCDDCADGIGVERLQAYPTAKRCHPCQSRHEESYLQPRRPTL
jgi:RNA polymerase-binding protein DksA